MVALYPCPNGAHVAWGVLGDGVRDMPPFQARELPPVLSAIKCIEIGGNLFDFTVAEGIPWRSGKVSNIASCAPGSVGEIHICTAGPAPSAFTLNPDKQVGGLTRFRNCCYKLPPKINWMPVRNNKP